MRKFSKPRKLIRCSEGSRFGMDYAVGGQLGGLGQGYVSPNMMYFGTLVHSIPSYEKIGEFFTYMLNDMVNEFMKAGDTVSLNAMRKFCGMIYGNQGCDECVAVLDGLYSKYVRIKKEKEFKYGQRYFRQ